MSLQSVCIDIIVTAASVIGNIHLVFSLVPRPPPFFVLRFAFSIIHGSRSSTSVYYTERKLKNKKKWGRPGNKAS